MTLRLGDTAPNFQQQSSEGIIDFYEFLGDSWEFCFHILPTILRFVPLNWAILQSLKTSLNAAE